MTQLSMTDQLAAALQDALWQLRETAAYDDAKKGEDPSLFEVVADGERVLREHQVSTANRE